MKEGYAMRTLLRLFAAGVLISPPALAQADDFPWLRERKIMGENNLEPIESAKGSAYHFSRPVARVETLEGSGYCTASRVSETLFLTNFHCDMGCERMRFTLDYERAFPADKRVSFKCSELLHKNETYDYAVFRVEPLDDAAGAYGSETESEIPILTLYRGPVIKGQKLIVPGHPGARYKEIDRSPECFLASAEIVRTESGRDTMYHMCDTEGGSSGSPVIDRKMGYAIGLHWGGRTGLANYVIPMHLILGDMAQHLPKGAFGELMIAD